MGVLCSTREGVPLVLLEYAAAGVPVVATRAGGVPDVIQDGVNGFLVPPENAQALADRTIQLLKDPALGTRTVVEGRRILEGEFSVQMMAQRVSKLYVEVLDEGR